MSDFVMHKLSPNQPPAGNSSRSISDARIISCLNLWLALARVIYKHYQSNFQCTPCASSTVLLSTYYLYVIDNVLNNRQLGNTENGTTYYYIEKSMLLFGLQLIMFHFDFGLGCSFAKLQPWLGCKAATKAKVAASQSCNLNQRQDEI